MVVIQRYKPRAIRDVILSLGKGYVEIMTYDPNVRYFQNEQPGSLVRVRMDDDAIRDEIEFMCELLGITIDEFDEMYKKAKKHKL